jgi:hypothetical protein
MWGRLSQFKHAFKLDNADATAFHGSLIDVTEEGDRAIAALDEDGDD